MLTKEQISNPNQSFTGLLDHRKVPVYRIPGRKKSSLMMPTRLSKSFMEFCYDGSNEAFNCGAVIGKARKGYKNEKWTQCPDEKGNTTDSLDLLTPNGSIQSYSLYRGLNKVLTSRSVPIYVPKTSLVIDGVKSLQYLRKNKINESEINQAFSFWKREDLIYRMTAQVTIKPENRTPSLDSQPETTNAAELLALADNNFESNPKMESRIKRLSKTFN